MVILTLLEKIYGLEEDKALESLRKFLSSFSSGLEAEIKVLGKTENGWIQVEISGLDSIIVTNYLNKKFGLAPSNIEELHAQSELRGKVVDSGRIGFGLYVDVGVSSQRKMDALVPLYTLRKQLLGDQKLSLRRITEAFCLRDNFPLKIKLTRIDVGKYEMGAELSESQLATFDDWLILGLDRVLVLGASLEQVEYAIRKSDSMRDITRIDQLGFLETTLICKIGTEAPGIINRIGHFLPRIPIYAFMPKKIQMLRKA
ncbi:MAG: hypothetical protein QG670_1261 [Thermoproteota archaeon]|nr:hypothetical protein [Thermoproteota archaeon]